MCFYGDDYSNDIYTTGVITIGEPKTASLYCDDGEGGDADWFRVSLVAETTYVFDVISEDDWIEELLFDELGRRIRRLDYTTEPFGNTFRLVFTPSETATFFLGVYDVIGEAHGSYTVDSFVLTEFADDPDTLGRLFIDRPKASQIESAYDRDWYRVFLYSSRSYDFDLKGSDTGDGTLADPNLRIYDENGNLVVQNNNGGSGRNAHLRFSPASNGYYFISAAGVHSRVGSYLLTNEVLDDFAGDGSTAGRLPVIANQLSTVSGDLERAGDIDWFKVNLQGGRWYRFDTNRYSSTLILRNPAGEVVRIGNGASQTSAGLGYYASESGDHYVIIRDFEFTYSIAVTDNSPPVLPLADNDVTLEGNESISFASVLGYDENPVVRYQVYSTGDLNFLGETKQRNQIHYFTPTEIPLLTASPGIQQGEYDVYLRADRGDNIWTGWRNVSIVATGDQSTGLQTGHQWNSENTVFPGKVSFTFSKSVPWHHGNRYPGFQEVDRLQSRIRQILYSWRFPTGLSIVEGDEDADIQIFKADIPEYVSSFRPGRHGHGDIIINAARYNDAADVEPGGRLYFELVRAVGKALGLKHYTDEYDLAESVMGKRNTNINGYYPTSPGIFDVRNMQDMYGVGPAFPPANSYYRFSTRDPKWETISSNARTKLRITGANFPGDLHIDIREGRTSYVSDPNMVVNRFTVGPDVYVHDVSGGNGDDVIVGNARANRIEAGPGKDTIVGLQGNDNLLGGSDDDFYVYALGHGNDLIYDSGGNDTLRINGTVLGLSDLTDDFSFRRNGNDLIVNLDLNRTINRRHGVLTLRNMSETVNRIERLVLFDNDVHVGSYSLASVWDQSTNLTRRFKPIDGYDQHGQLVSVA